MSQHRKPPVPELRRRVYTCMDKLSDRSTLSQAVSELEFIARSLPSDSLSSFLSCILSADASSKSPVRVHCLNLLSLLAQTHSHSLSPHVPKTIAPVLLRRLRDPDSAVRTAVVSAATALAPLGFSSLLGPFLGAVVTEQDGNAQIGSCLSLKAAVDSAGVVGGAEEAELLKAVPKLLKLVKGEGFKAKPSLLGLIASVVAVNDGSVVNGRGGLVGNVVGCAVEMLCSEDWASRKAAAEVLEAVALAAERESAQEFKRFVVNSLESRRFDKVKITRETMNRALEAWKDVPGGPEEEFLFSRSNSSISKENGSHESSPPRFGRSSFAGLETPKSKKATKTRSSLSGGAIVSISSSNSTSTNDVTGIETSQRRKTMCKSSSSSSDESTITDSSLVSKSSDVGGFETFQPKKPTYRNRSSLPEDYAATVTKKNTSSLDNNRKTSKSSDWKIDMVFSTPMKVVTENDMQSQCDIVEVTTSDSEASSDFFKKTPEEVVLKVKGLRSGSRVVPFVEEEEPQGLVVESGANEEVSESNSDIEELSLIRNQLLQMERQQSNLLDLLLRFMGNSQNGIDSLETRVSGLERALDEISYDLGVRSGRIPSNDSARSSCCPSTEFLSPKFWRRTEGRSSLSKSYCSGSGGHNKDSNVEALQVDGRRLYEQKEGICSRDSWQSVEINTTKSRKSIGHNS